MGTFNPRRQRGKGHSNHTGQGGPLRPVFSDDERWGQKPDYKTAALCKQVRRAISMTLSGECGDPILQSLIVDDVLPAPNASRMLVRVMLRAGTATLTDVLERLAKVEGLLRARIGETIVRKRTPELAFEIIPVGTPPIDPPPDNSEGEAPHA